MVEEKEIAVGLGLLAVGAGVAVALSKKEKAPPEEEEEFVEEDVELFIPREEELAIHAVTEFKKETLEVLTVISDVIQFSQSLDYQILASWEDQAFEKQGLFVEFLLFDINDNFLDREKKIINFTNGIATISKTDIASKALPGIYALEIVVGGVPTEHQFQIEGVETIPPPPPPIEEDEPIQLPQEGPIVAPPPPLIEISYDTRQAIGIFNNTVLNYPLNEYRNEIIQISNRDLSQLSYPDLTEIPAQDSVRLQQISETMSDIRDNVQTVINSISYEQQMFVETDIARMKRFVEESLFISRDAASAIVAYDEKIRIEFDIREQLFAEDANIDLLETDSVRTFTDSNQPNKIRVKVLNGTPYKKRVFIGAALNISAEEWTEVMGYSTKDALTFGAKWIDLRPLAQDNEKIIEPGDTVEIQFDVPSVYRRPYFNGVFTVRGNAWAGYDPVSKLMVFPRKLDDSQFSM